ncbi:AAA family ATPase [Pseudonocardia spinosispora]|uniref:AAA family ATPase n=1 Tax=Pseudonocardia spinosispora TaxID=103441 RepID=UPI00146FB354|nr:AAA family ATPase [Pseudonocardia spinosispora]
MTGAPGVGKSTAGWALYTRLASADDRVAYVDIDQLRLFVPAPADDPERHRLKATNLLEVIDTFRRNGARQVIVSGVVDPHRGIEPYVRGTEAEYEFTLVRLRCARDELRRRYLGRGSSGECLDELMSLADKLDRDGLGVPLDTTTRSPHEVVEALIERVDRQQQEHSIWSGTQTVHRRLGADVPVLLLVNPTAVGKSAVGWEVMQSLGAKGVTAAYIDVDQLGFVQPECGPVKAEALTGVWRGYRAAGARALIVVARGAPPAYEPALAGENLTTVCLDASPTDLADRVARRGQGGWPWLAGDSLTGAPDWRLAQVTSRAVAERTIFHRRLSDATTVIDTSIRSSRAVVATLTTLLTAAAASRSVAVADRTPPSGQSL